MNHRQEVFPTGDGAVPGGMLHTILEHVPAGAHLCDADGRITYYNRRAVELWGRAPRLNDPADRYCGSFRLYAADGSPIRHSECWMALALRDQRDYCGREIQIERPDGERRRVVAHATLLRADDGRVAGAVNLLVDVTPLVRAEERLGLLLESIEDHFVQYDRAWRYVFITEKGAAFIGKKREELLGRCIWELFPDAVGNLYYEKVHEAARTGQTLRFEHYYPPLDGWFENHVYPTAEGVTVFATNITQRKRAERALRAAEARHAALLDLVPAGVYRCDAQGALRYYNQRAVELWGRAPDMEAGNERFCGSLRLYTAAGKPVPHDQCPMADVLRSGMPVRNMEVMIERPDGTRITALVNIDVLRDDAGTVTGAVNIFQDITERKRADEIRGRLAAVVESSHDAIIGKDLRGRVTSWNAAAERLYGYTAHEMLGQLVTRLYPPGRAEEEDRVLARIRAGELVEKFETIRRHKNGAPLEVSWTVSPVRDADGRIVGASSVSHDISERKARERALRESESRYRSLAEASGAIVFTSNACAEWIAPNPAWEAYTGQTFAEYRNHGWTAAIHPDDRARIQTSIAAAIAAGSAWHEEGRLWHAASAAYRHQEARAVPLRDAAGQIHEWVGTCLDVHARRTAEEAIREADRRKDEFLAVLAHELRNPLAPIVSSLEILRMPHAAAAQFSVLDVLDRQVTHLVRLVDDLMEVSRITRGAIELRCEPLTLGDAVRAAIEISRPLIDDHGHRLTLEVAGDVSVNGDRVRITQIVANLLNNAAKYTPRGGNIRVRVEERDGKARVSVLDDGVGIPKDLQAGVFEMFRRGSGTMERFASGLGIGLGLARRLAELHLGTIEVVSQGVGRGSEFILVLPATAGARKAFREAAPNSPQENSRRVLVVDDNTDAATSLAALLRALGHDVRTAHNANDALRLAEQLRPQVALLDLGMPAPDGFELAQRIRAQPWGTSIKLVAISGWGQDSDRQRSQDCGFDLHLVKPVGLDEVRRVLTH